MCYTVYMCNRVSTGAQWCMHYHFFNMWKLKLREI